MKRVADYVTLMCLLLFAALCLFLILAMSLATLAPQ